jgi:hypothetical protein
MPLKSYGNCKTKACKQKVISSNIRELHNNVTKQRSNKQIVAIAFSSAKRKK